MKKHIDSLFRIIRDHITKAVIPQLRSANQAVTRSWADTCERTRQGLNRLHVLALKWGITAFHKLQGFARYLSYCIVSIFATVIAGMLWFPKAQEALRQFQNYHDVLVAAGGLIGTMLALVFSLSIIPAQIMLLGIALDLLHWHHRRVSQLLEPRESVNRLYQQIAHHIDRTQRLVAQAARIEWRAQSLEFRAKQSSAMTESGIYARWPNSHTPENNGTSELAEKVDLGQSWLLWHITGTIRHIAQVYLGLLKEPMTNDAYYVDELATHMSRYLSFYRRSVRIPRR